MTGARFDYRAFPAEVRFGAGRRGEVADAVRSLGARRVLVLSTPEQAGEARAVVGSLGGLAAGSFTGATMHTPVEVTEAAMKSVRRLDADCLVAVGGGSTIGLGKAIALRTDLPQVVIPTTYAGSEMTDIIGETADGEKTTQRTERVRPEIVIYDVELTLSLPPLLSAASGMNAIAHAVEALYARDGNPVIGLMAKEAIAALARGLRGIVAAPGDVPARQDAQYGAWLAAACLGSVSMALHHKLCHVLGGAFGLPHAETHAIVLPHAAAYNRDAAPEAMSAVAEALGGGDAPELLHGLGAGLGTPVSLRALGMPAAGIERAVALALSNPYWNPRPLEEAPIRQLIENAYEGRRPVPA